MISTNSLVLSGSYDDGLVAHPAADVVEAGDRLPRSHHAVEERGPAREQGSRDEHEQREDEARDHQPPLTRRISAEIAGTTSCRSPTTA